MKRTDLVNVLDSVGGAVQGLPIYRQSHRDRSGGPTGGDGDVAAESNLISGAAGPPTLSVPRSTPSFQSRKLPRASFEPHNNEQQAEHNHSRKLQQNIAKA